MERRFWILLCALSGLGAAQLHRQRKPLRNAIEDEAECGQWEGAVEETWESAGAEWDDIRAFVRRSQSTFRLPALDELEVARDSAYVVEDSVSYLYEHHYLNCESEGCSRPEHREDWDAILVETQAFSAEIEDYIEWRQQQGSSARNQRDRFKETAKTEAAIHRLAKHFEECLRSGGGSGGSGGERVPDEALDILYAVVRKEGKMTPAAQNLLAQRDVKGYLDWMRREGLSLPPTAFRELEAVRDLPSEELRRIRDFYEAGQSGGRAQPLSAEGRRLLEDILGQRLSFTTARALDGGKTASFERDLQSAGSVITERQLAEAQALKRRGQLSSAVLETITLYFDRQGFSREAVFALQDFAGQRIPLEIREKLERGGDAEAFLDWLESEAIQVPQQRMMDLEDRLDQSSTQLPAKTLSRVREWHAEHLRNQGFSRSAIMLMERSLNRGRMFPNSVEVGLQKGNLEPFLDWAKREDVRVESRSFDDLVRKLEAEKVPALHLRSLRSWAKEQTSLKLSRRSMEAIQRFVGVRNIPRSVERELKESGDYVALFSWMERERLDVPRGRLSDLYSDLRGSGQSGWEETYEEFRRWWDAEFGRDGRSKGLSVASINSLRIFAGRTIPSEYQAELRRGELQRFLRWAASVNRPYGISRVKMLTLVRQLADQDVNKEHVRTIRRWWEETFETPKGFSSAAVGSLAEYAGVRRSQIPFSVERELENSGKVDKLLTWLDTETRGKRIPDQRLDQLKRRLAAEKVPAATIKRLEDWHRGKFRERGLSAAAVSALQSYVGRDMPAIPFALRRELMWDGDMAPFVRWATEERRKLDVRRLQTAERALKAASVGDDQIEALRRFHEDGSSSGGGGSARITTTERPRVTSRRPPTNLRIGSRSIRQLKALAGLRGGQSFPSSVTQHLAAGDIEPFFDYLTMRRIRPSSGAKRDFLEMCRRRRLRKGFCQLVTQRLRLADPVGLPAPGSTN